MGRKFRRIKIPRTKYGYKIECKACKYIWFPKLKTPVFCPRCRQKI